MKNFIDTLKNVWKIDELKNRILLTLGLLLIYRFGAHVTLPGIDASQLHSLAGQTEKGLGSILDMFTGGAFSKSSVFALGIMPYISASIVVQLMGIAIPYLQKLQKDGESGRKKINQITRWLTIGITLLQGPGYIYNLGQTIPNSAFLLDRRHTAEKTVEQYRARLAEPTVSLQGPGLGDLPSLPSLSLPSLDEVGGALAGLRRRLPL